jgi:meso-butanediol dehydrogenase/(S,S)-butanediol dehydrogenase/diacetyl reductase
MKCPVCSETELKMAERQGIEIDYCPQCRGVWPDRGELDKIIERPAAVETQAGARQMVEQAPLAAGRPGGKIINVASIAGRIGRSMFPAYPASKAAAISITQSAARALAPKVTVNAICPGVVDTAMWQQIDSEWTQIEQRPVGAAWQDRIRGISMGRPETAEDLTGMALFLASADSHYITGQSYHVDGGLVML